MGGYPALAIRPPTSPIEQLGQAQQIVGQRQQIQTQALQQQMLQQQITDQKAITDAMTQWDGKNYQELPMLVLRSGGSGQAAMGLSQQVLGMKQKASEIAKDDALTLQANTDATIKQNDQYRGRLLNIVGMQDPAAKQAAWDQEVTSEEQAGKIQPGTLPHQYPGDQGATAMANHFALGSKLVEEAKEQSKLGLDAWKSVGGRLVNAITHEEIGGIQDVNVVNQGMKARWAVLHPGEQIPDYFQLKQGDGPEEFNRVDKLLEATEKGTATKAQQDTVNAIRQQTYEMQREKTDMSWTIGQDPKTGNQVMVPAGQAQQMGIQNAGKAPDDTINKALSGRHWLQLALKQGDPKGEPDQMGIMQLIDKLDAEGKLGPLASRWNDFMTKSWGSGDPEYSALRAKMGLSTTLLAQTHVGNRSGPQILEHFEDLANEKKMDGPTLKAGFKSEVNYVTDKAMDPNPPSYKPPAAAPKEAAPAKATTPPKEATHIVPGPDGKNHYTNAAGTVDYGIAP